MEKRSTFYPKLLYLLACTALLSKAQAQEKADSTLAFSSASAWPPAATSTEAVRGRHEPAVAGQELVKRTRRASSHLAMSIANPTRLRADVEFLTSIQPARNYRNLASLDKAAAYIHAEFQQLGCVVQEQKYRVDGHDYRNVIASFGPPAAERLIVGAHYDVCGDQPGADDNASAVAGLLETARLLQAHAATLKRRIDLVAFSLEEPPYFATEHMGSAVHAQSLHAAKVPVRAMICYEMIGYFSDAPGSQQFPTPALAAQYPSTGNFITVVGKQGQEAFTQQLQTLMQQHSAIDVQRINLPTSVGLAGLSDHRNYWHYGYQAVMINDTAFLRNPNYHQPTDTIDTLDFRRMAEVVNGVVGALLAL